MGHILTVIIVAIGCSALGFMAGYFYHKDKPADADVLGYPGAGAKAPPCK